MFSWVPNGYVKYPCTHEGLRAAQASVKSRIRVNMTLCFSQDQAAAVYSATRGAKRAGVCFVVRNILRMYRAGDGHVWVLATSKRHLDHLLCSFALGAELATAPGKVLQEWAANGQPVPDQSFVYKGIDSSGHSLKPIQYKDLDLKASWDSFDPNHALTKQGIQKFVADY